ncbi:hypothetical protein V6Z12_D02G042300 [Gossypium hirsutum]|uniref:Uncharacterized protein n=1 Tax=Gossypium darwinii TaxID=34276 RepID=A0A5D2DB01_GOSDA|nr:hypothetical protein ES288_D02G041000v1 [Gossypium darwinii]
MCSKRVAVDARHHMLGRLASILDKELLNGQKVVVVRCEEICMWGGLVSQKMNLMRFLRERMNTDLAYHSRDDSSQRLSTEWQLLLV